MLCSYMCIEAGVRAYDAGYTLLPCNAFNHTNPPIGFILYVFYLSKILDFMDTFFIIAEKRWKQLSFLHVYHHFSIFLFYWLNLNVGYDSDVYMTIVLNGFIHTVMYTYYFVSLHTKEIWWKSALTMSQMIQFVVMNRYITMSSSTSVRQNYTPSSPLSSPTTSLSNILWQRLFHTYSLTHPFLHSLSYTLPHLYFSFHYSQAIYLIVTDCKSFPRNITLAYGYYILVSPHTPPSNTLSSLPSPVLAH